MLLPKIKDKIIFRPGDLSGGFDKCWVPKSEEEKFWNSIYLILKGRLQFPLRQGKLNIDHYFGYFGYRFHPINLHPNYFHIGIDVMAGAGTNVYPVSQSVFEYSGFSELNGNYILLSHPEIKTEDGYTLHSMYIHLKSHNFRFNLFQKIIRELGGRKLTNIEIDPTTVIGEVGATGNIKGLVPHLHLQFEFRDSKRSVIAIDPMRAFGLGSSGNLTKSIQSLDEFKTFYTQHRQDLSPWSKLWDFR